MNHLIDGNNKVYISQDAVAAKNSIITDATIMAAGVRNIATDTDMIQQSSSIGVNPKVSDITEIPKKIQEIPKYIKELEDLELL